MSATFAAAAAPTPTPTLILPDSVTGPDAGAVVDDPLELGAFTRWSTAADGVRLGESTLQVSGMVCAACADIVEQAMSVVPGIVSARVSAAAQRATVRWDPARTSISALLAAVRAAGYGAVPDAAAPGRALREAEGRLALWRFFVAAFCTMQVMMFATPSYLADPGTLAPDLAQLLNWGSWVLSLPVLLFSSGPFFAGAWRGLRQRRMVMDVPVALGIVVTFVASTGASFDPGGPFGSEVYFDSLTMFVSFLLGGRWLELRARHRALQALEAALARMPRSAWRLAADGSVETVSVQRLRPGDRVRVPAGEAIPADGELLRGHTQADESLLSGESAPVPKAPGAALVGGSLNLGAPIEMRVERTGADSRYEAILALMRDAATQRPSLARVADRWAGPFVWVVLLLAAGAAAAWSLIDPSRAVWVAVSVLIVTCPCALSLAVPAAFTAAAGGLARRGVLLQRLDAIEGLARMQHLFIDKTGTLTEGRLRLADVRPTGLMPQAEALALAASLASWSQHPLAQALVAAGSGSVAGCAWTAVAEVPGAGVQAVDPAGRHWQLGSAAWIGAALPAGARVGLACDSRLQAAFDFDEAPRDDAADALARLRADGVQVTLLSGDTPARAARLAALLGLSEAVGGASPQAKLELIAAAQGRGQRVAMVGDGINDAPVLARADVSLAMGQGALVARAGADAVIVSNRLGDLVLARRTARRALAIAHQNIAWAAAYNAACIPLALAGWLPPWAAGLGMAASSLLVVGNALRAGR